MASSTKAIDANTGVKKKSIFSGWTSVKKKKQADLSVKEDSSSHHFTSDVRDQPSDDSLHAAPTSPSDHTASAAAHGNHHEAKTGGSGVPQLDGKLPQEVHSSPFPSVHDGPTPASISDVYSRWGRWSTMCRTLMCPPPSRNGQPIGLLELDIFEGFRLPASDMGISSDPYLVATLTGYWSHGQEWAPRMRSEFKTSVKKATLYPKWNASCKFYIPRAGAVLRLEVFDKDNTSADDRLGFIEVPVESLLGGRKEEHWLRLVLAAQFRKHLRALKHHGHKASSTHEENPRRTRMPRGLSSGSFREPFGWSSSTVSNSNASPKLSSQPSVVEFDEDEDDDDDGVENWHVEERVSAKASAKHGFIETFTGRVSKYLRNGGGSKASKFGDHACVKVAMKLHYSPLGEALTGLVWPEDEFVEVPSKFDIERTLTEIFKLLRLIGPIVDFFNSDDQKGLVNHWNWERPFRSAFWCLFMATLYAQHPHAIWSFFQLYLVYCSYNGYWRRRHLLMQYRIGQALRKQHKLGPADPADPNKNPIPPQLAREAGYLLPQDLEALAKGAPMPLSDAAAAAQASATQRSTSQLSLHYDDHEKSSGSAGVDCKKSSGSASGGSGSGEGHHPEDVWGNTLGGEANVAVVGRPPIAARYGPVAPSRWASLEKVVAKALWQPMSEPAFYGRPPDLKEHALYNQAVPVRFDSEAENDANFNWCPEDDYQDCAFGLGGTVKALLDQLINLLRAPWMDTVENLLLKINGILDALHGLLDWRNPTKCLAVAGILTASALLHLFVPFSRFLWVLNYFLYAFWTPVWEWGIKLVTLPINLPKRLRQTAALRNEKPLKRKVKRPSSPLLSPVATPSGARHNYHPQHQIKGLGAGRAPRALDRHVPDNHDGGNEDDHDDIPALVYANDGGGHSPSPASSPGSRERSRKRLSLERAPSSGAPEAAEGSALEDNWPVHPLLEKLLVPDGRSHHAAH